MTGAANLTFNIPSPNSGGTIDFRWEVLRTVDFSASVAGAVTNTANLIGTFDVAAADSFSGTMTLTTELTMHAGSTATVLAPVSGSGAGNPFSSSSTSASFAYTPIAGESLRQTYRVSGVYFSPASGPVTFTLHVPADSTSDLVRNRPLPL